MKNKYENIDFNKFKGEPVEMTNEEKARLLQGFRAENAAVESATVEAKKKGDRKPISRFVAIAAACVLAVGICVPTGIIEEAGAFAQNALMSLGVFTNVPEQDGYETVLEQSQTKGGIKMTLNSVVGDNRGLIFTITTEYTDKDKTGKPPSGFLGQVWIDGKLTGKDIFSHGVGRIGSPLYDKTITDGKRTVFEKTDCCYEMPLNPNIKATVAAGGEVFTFEFTLRNEKILEDTKKVEINKTYEYNGVEVKLLYLEASPLSQGIYFETNEELEDEDRSEANGLSFYGTNNLGDNVQFLLFAYYGNDFEMDNYMFANREIEDGEEEFLHMQFEGVNSYTLYPYDENLEPIDADPLVIEWE